VGGLVSRLLISYVWGQYTPRAVFAPVESFRHTSNKALSGLRTGLDPVVKRNIFVLSGNRTPTVHSQVCSLAKTVTKLWRNMWKRCVLAGGSLHPLLSCQTSVASQTRKISSTPCCGMSNGFDPKCQFKQFHLSPPGTVRSREN